MKRRSVWLASLALLFCAALSERTQAFLGFGDVVFDPSVYAQAVQQVIRLEQQYVQLVETYAVVRSQYAQMVRMAQQVPVNMSARYRAAATPWRYSTATNTYGTTSAWITAINSGVDVPGAFERTTETLHPYGAGLGNLPLDQQARLKSGYATVELTGGAAQNAIGTIGRLRFNAPAVENAIQGLENDSLSSAPDMNTEVAVLNKINAANLISIRTAQDTNKLLVALAETQVIEAKRTRDAEARAINQHVRFVSEGKAVLTAQAAGASDAMRAWRMP